MKPVKMNLSWVAIMALMISLQSTIVQAQIPFWWQTPLPTNATVLYEETFETFSPGDHITEWAGNITAVSSPVNSGQRAAIVYDNLPYTSYRLPEVYTSGVIILEGAIKAHPGGNCGFMADTGYYPLRWGGWTLVHWSDRGYWWTVTPPLPPPDYYGFNVFSYELGNWHTVKATIYLDSAPTFDLDFDGTQVVSHAFYPIHDPATGQTFHGISLQGGYRGPNYVDDLRIVYIPPIQVIPIDIDIKPGSDDNPINLKSQGVIPVAILTTDDFDAATVDGSTVVFAGTHPAHKDGHLEDVDGDGDIDWIGHFETQETDIAPDATEVMLTGQTVDGQDIEGSDAIRIVGDNAKKKSKKPVVGVEADSWGAVKETVK